MTFTSFQFGIFVAIVFGVYYLPSLRGFQVPLLVLASVFFYGFGQPELLPLLLVAVLGTHVCLVLAFENRTVWMPAGIVFNLGLLAFFKYKFLFVDAGATHLTGVAPIGSGSRSRKSIGATPVRWTAAASTNRSLYLKNASRPRLKTMPAGIQKVRFSNASTRQR